MRPRHFMGMASFVMGTLLGAPAALGLSVNLIATTPVTDVRVGDIVSFDITLDFTGDPTLGGGFDVLFDESQLSLAAIEDDFMLGEIEFHRRPDYVPGSGLLESWAVGAFVGITTGRVGSVSFEVLAGATSTIVALGLTSGAGGPWFSSIDFICCQDPDYGQVTVSAVPLPPALFLLPAALGCLGVLRRSQPT